MKAGQSLQSQLHQLLLLPQVLPQGSSDSDNKVKPITTPLLKIVNNTVVFDNTLYQIRNISTVALADLTETYAINQSVPEWYWFLLALGLILLFYYGLGILILIIVGCFFWEHKNLQKSRTVEQYGLRIRMNSGEEVILASKSKDFVLTIVLTLYNIMNSDEPKAIEFNFDTLKIDRIEDKSISIEKNYGSTVISGQVTGDVVNNI
ncbi:DUF6232 family protein [Argonema galeatum]|uniref:DUF6232 family protein n=1 Tax=Argonema galeatum TaxID=2942762 RepID=UPI0020124753|nr:DUF6232 family protein [Argonema galeatum]MCL1464164.1 DUF6232 family protein [Argonema galeatum A003/A1]